MKFIKTSIPDVFIIEPKVLGDSRGYFMEAFSEKSFTEYESSSHFIQDNESKSGFGVLRGMHLQKPPYTQAKLVRVILGKVLDVVVDLRTDSPAFGKHISVEISDENKRQLFVPRGFAHGFVVLSEYAIFSYKVDNHYFAGSELGVHYNDKDLAIDWKLSNAEIRLSEKDNFLPGFTEQKYYKSIDYQKNI